MSRRPLVAVLAAAALAVTAGGALAAVPASDAQLVTVASTVSHLDGYSRVGDVDPASPVEVAVTLRRPDGAGELATYRSLYDPASPDYRHFLSVADFAARFGVPRASFDAASGWVTGTGMQVMDTSAARDYLLLQGTAAQAEQLFGVELATYAAPDGSRFTGNTGPARVPAGLGIDGVVGLNTRDRSHLTSSGPHSHIGPAAAPHPAQDGCTGPACTGLTTPQDLWKVYDQP